MYYIFYHNFSRTSREVWGGIEELVDMAIELGRWASFLLDQTGSNIWIV